MLGELLRGATHRAVRAEHAAVAREGLDQRPTDRAFEEADTRIERHVGLRLRPALRAAEGGPDGRIAQTAAGRRAEAAYHAPNSRLTAPKTGTSGSKRRARSPLASA